MDQSDPFDSVLSSLVSSPQASDAGAFNGADCVMMTELIGRLGSIGNSGDRGTNNNNSTNSSCYVTPLNSPSKLNLSMTDPHIKLDFPIPIIPGNDFPSLVADPGFAERAARFSCFWGQNGQSLGLDGTQFSYRSIMTTSNQSSMLPTNQSLKASGKKFINRSSSPEFGDSREGSSLSEQIPCGESSGNRKRKSIPRGKAKETLSSTSAKTGKVGNEETNAKRIKTADETFGNEKDTQKEKKENNSKPPEPPKDYIHVRARRGQATDSHSLAERVRREKISERMKYLQDLVPGCNKVTGKAVMLDEIINYVQSLQRQVEFLSMKLSTVNSRMDLNTEALLSKEVFQSHNHGVHSLDSSMTTSFPFGYHPQQVPNSTSSGGETQFLLNPYLNIAHHQNSGIQFPPMDGLTAQVPTLFEDDLQSLVQTSFGPTSQPSSNNCNSMAASQ